MAARLPLFVAVDGVTDMPAEVFRYAQCDAFGGMATSQAADRPEIQARLALLLGSARELNEVVAALATRETAGYEGSLTLGTRVHGSLYPDYTPSISCYQPFSFFSLQFLSHTCLVCSRVFVSIHSQDPGICR